MLVEASNSCRPMIELFTYVAVSLDPSLTFATFHDPEALYSVTLTLADNGDGFDFEFMVADQSCYAPGTLAVELHRHWMRVTLPPGTIDAADGGDDVYEVHFRIDDAEHAELGEALAHMLRGRGTLQVLPQ